MRKKALKNAVERVIRGGSYYYDSWSLRTSVRFWNLPENRSGNSGFRLVARQK
jgi:formylglycine-generating enzyme required for sulfatase activity